MPSIKMPLIVSAALLCTLPHGAEAARTGSMTVGLSTSYDYEDRQYDAATDSVGVELAKRTEKDEQLGLTPSMVLVSEGQMNRIELRLAPTLVYDLRDSETDWNANFGLIGDHTFSRSWRARASNTFIRSDYHNPDFLDITPPEEQPETGPDLLTSTELGRDRYWQNNLSTDLFYTYGAGREAGVGVDWSILRQDETSLENAEDFDRYALRLINDYRLNSFWANTASFSVVRGEFADPQDNAANEPENNLWEYIFRTGIENNSFHLTRLLADYSYTATRYDQDSIEDQSEDVDIHKMRFTWIRDVSRQWNIGIGAGPTYIRRDVRDDQWGGNGQIDINYRERNTTGGFVLEKGYDVDDFSGTDESGLVDTTTLRLTVGHQVLERLAITGALYFQQQTRDQPLNAIDDAGEGSDDYTEDLYTASIGLRYSFLRYYSLGLDYTYSTLESDLPGNDYEDHRVLLSLSWEQEWMRW